MINDTNINDNLDEKNSTIESPWDLLKKAREQKKKEQLEEFEQEKQAKLIKKAAKKESKLQLKELNKSTKKEIANLKPMYHQEIHNLKATNINKEEFTIQHDTIQSKFFEKRIELRDLIRQRHFDFGKKYNTLKWRMTKWTYGIRKEFFRIIWSSPKNTFKYLGIIIVIVIILSLLFFGIDSLVALFK